MATKHILFCIYRSRSIGEREIKRLGLASSTKYDVKLPSCTFQPSTRAMHERIIYLLALTAPQLLTYRAMGNTHLRELKKRLRTGLRTLDQDTCLRSSLPRLAFSAFTSMPQRPNHPSDKYIIIRQSLQLEQRVPTKDVRIGRRAE
jgi:hypothetical protein